MGPLPGAPFWQGSVDTLPYFLRDAPLDAQGRWDEILRLADSWASAYPADAEALLVRGKALQKLNFPRAARDAFNAALKLAPDEPAAWYGLALASALAGDATMSRYAETKLESLDQRLAAELEKELGEGAGER